MLLTYAGPAFHSTRNAPRGVSCPPPGLPGSIWTGPNVVLPLACSQVMCLVRSTHAVAVTGQWRRSAAVSTSGTAARRAGGAALVSRGAPAALAPRGKLTAGRGDLLAAGAAFAPAAGSWAGRAVGRMLPWFPAITAATIPVTATRTATAAVVLSRVRDRG